MRFRPADDDRTAEIIRADDADYTYTSVGLGPGESSRACRRRVWKSYRRDAGKPAPSLKCHATRAVRPCSIIYTAEEPGAEHVDEDGALTDLMGRSDDLAACPPVPLFDDVDTARAY